MTGRREFSVGTKRAARDRANGVCECRRIPGWPGCGRPLGPGNTFFEHIICDGAGGEPTLENCAVLTKTCWRKKTSEHDQPTVAKTKRMRDRDSGIRRVSRPVPGSKSTRWRKRMDGTVERRT